MPCYVYHCHSCNTHFQVRHGMKEAQNKCLRCDDNGHLTRVPQIPSIVQSETVEDHKTGRVTEECIGDNQQLLRDMKEEARNQIYED